MDDKLPFEPPEPKYVAEHYILRIPVTDKHFKSPWELRKHAAKLLEKELGDDVQLTSLKVKQPGYPAKLWAKLTGKVPEAKLHVTIKF